MKKLLNKTVMDFENPFLEEIPTHRVFFKIRPRKRKYFFSVKLKLNADLSVIEKLECLYYKDIVRTHHANFASGKSVILDALVFIDSEYESCVVNRETQIIKIEDLSV
jgi:hypothetical protein